MDLRLAESRLQRALHLPLAIALLLALGSLLWQAQWWAALLGAPPAMLLLHACGRNGASGGRLLRVADQWLFVDALGVRSTPLPAAAVLQRFWIVLPCALTNGRRLRLLILHDMLPRPQWSELRRQLLLAHRGSSTVSRGSDASSG